jgi:hypothetical protein
MESIRRGGSVAQSIGIPKDRNRLRCTLEVDGEGIAEEMLHLAYIVHEVADHACCHDERKTNDEIDGNVSAGSEEKGCLISVLSDVSEMYFKPDRELRRDRRIVRSCNNA